MPLLPNTPPIEAYITSTEQAANKLPSQEADELRSDVNRILKQLQQHNKQCNLNPSQCRALTELKQDNSRVVVTADKGMAMVIMDKQDYINTTSRHQHLQSSPQRPHPSPQKQTHYPSQRHQTNRRPIHPKIQTALSHQCSPPKFYGLPKIHKAGTPSDPLFPVGGPSHMGLPRSFPTSSNPW